MADWKPPELQDAQPPTASWQPPEIGNAAAAPPNAPVAEYNPLSVAPTTGNPMRNRRQANLRKAGTQVTPQAVEQARRDTPIPEGISLNPGEFISKGLLQLGSGVQDIGRGNYARGTHNVISGGMQASAPVALPLGLSVAPAATLIGMGVGMPAGAATEWVGNWIGDKTGWVTPDQSAVAGDIVGLLAGGRAAKSRLPKPGTPTLSDRLVESMLETRPKFQAPPRTEEFGRIVPPKTDSQVNGYDQKLELGMSEVLRDSPDLADGTFPVTRPGQTVADISQRFSNTLDRIWTETTNALQPMFQMNRRAPLQGLIAKVQDTLPLDPVTATKSWNGLSKDMRATLSNMAKQKYSDKEVWDLWHDMNSKLIRHYNKGATAQHAAEMTDADLRATEAILDALRGDLYNRAAATDPAYAEFVKGQMDRYGAVAMMRNNLAAQTRASYNQEPANWAERVVQGTLGLGKVGASGVHGVAWAAPNMQKAMAADKTTALSILRAFKNFNDAGPGVPLNALRVPHGPQQMPTGIAPRPTPNPGGGAGAGPQATGVVPPKVTWTPLLAPPGAPVHGVPIKRVK